MHVLLTGEGKIIGWYFQLTWLANVLTIESVAKQLEPWLFQNVPKAAFWSLLFKQDLAYVAYVKDALEFYEVDRIFVSENNVNSIFAKINFNGKVLTVRLAASDM